MRDQTTRSAGEAAFSLIELLVVMLIIGILAAIAIPAFLDQKGKASDTTAKEAARAASQAAENYETDHGGSYTGVSVKMLREYDESVQTAAGNNNAYLTVAEAQESGGGYVVTAVAPGTNDTFTITRTAAGEMKRTCKQESANSGGCRTGVW